MTAGDPLTLTVAEATARVARATRRDLTLVGPLAGGETGATEIRDGDDGRFVLKWESDPVLRARRLDGVVLAERLRTEASWPVPRQEAVEDGSWLFVVQELLPGRPVTLLTHRMVDTLLGANEAQRGLAKPSDPDRWAEDLITTLTEGGNGYCRHDSLRATTAAPAALWSGSSARATPCGQRTCRAATSSTGTCTPATSCRSTVASRPSWTSTSPRWATPTSTS